MPNVSSFGAQTDNAVVQGTVTDRQMIIPEVPPQGLMSVGPRVTPNFIKEPWSKLRSYNFFDVVKDVSGSSYIAIKPVVPVGTELTSEEFWFKSADPNAQINELNEIVKTFNERITQNTSAIAEETARATKAEEAKAPTNHASEDTIYGVGNGANYGHLRLATDETVMTSGANDGIAATPSYVADYFNKTPVRNINDLGVKTENADNSNALQKALDDSAGKYILYVPNGTYIFKNPVFIPSETVLIGNGSLSKFKFTCEKAFTVRSDENNYKIAHNVTVKNIAIEGPYIIPDIAEAENMDIYSIDKQLACFYGMFTQCNFEQLFISKFQVGISLIQAVQNPDYNVKYNEVYGDIRSWRNICVNKCAIGIWNEQADTFFDTTICQHTSLCYYGGYTVSNFHGWGFQRGIIATDGRFTNIELESQYTKDEPHNNVEPMILINTKQSVTFNNVRLWNRPVKGSRDVYHPYIFGEPNKEANAIINGLSIGPDQNESSILKSAIITSTYMNAIVFGAVDPSITESNDNAKNLISGSNANTTLFVYTNFSVTNGINIKPAKQTTFATVS